MKLNIIKMKGFIKIATGVAIGTLYGLLFAQKPGKKLREELQKSKTPLQTLVNEGKNVGIESKETIETWAQNSEDLQKVLASGKEQIKIFTEQAKTLSTEGRKKAQEKLEELSTQAKEAATELKEVAKESYEDLKVDTQIKGQKFKNKVTKNIKKITKK